MSEKPTYEELEQKVKVLEQEAVKRKQAEEMLLEREKKHRRIFENLQDVYYEADMGGTILEISPSIEKLSQYKREELIGKSLYDIYTNPNERDEFVKLILDKGKVNDYEIHLEDKDGSLHFCSVTTLLIRDSQGTPEKFIGSMHDITQRKQTEEKLRESEKRSRAWLESSPVCTKIVDLEFNLQFMSSSGIKDLKIDDIKEYYGKPYPLNFYPDSFRHSMTKSLEKAIETDEIIQLEEPIIDIEGNYLWYHSTIVPVHDEEGEIDYIMVVSINTTKRKRAEEAIKKNESMQRKMVANIGDVIVIIDQEGINRYKSPNIEKLFGWKTEDVVGAGAWENVHPEDLEAALKFIETLMHEPNAVGTTELRYRCKDGSYRWIQFTASNLLHDPDINGILGNYHDITDRKQAEQSLRESEARFKALHNASFGGIAIHDKGIILECNQGLSDITGYSETELIGMDGLLLIAEKSRNAAMNNIVGGYEKPYEATGLRKNGEEFPLRIEARNIPYKGKNVRVVEFRDLTERKKLEERIRQAQKMESIGTLAGGIAHDFNNILFPIVGYTEMLLQDIPEDSPLSKNLNEVFKGAMRAKKLVKQILAFSRQENYEIKMMKMQPVVKEALKLIRSTIPTSIEIKQYISNDCGPIKADPTQIHQVVMNLATNAYHAMEDTGGQLKVYLKEIELSKEDLPGPDMEPGPYACLTIADSGVGIDKEIRDKIYDPFFTTKGQGKGTGMGLSVIHGIVQSVGGSIQMYSETGKGTEFHVYVPVVKSSFEPLETQTKEPVQRGTEQILLVDDEDVIVSMEKQMLERLGYSVVSFTRSVEALEAFQANPDKFDLVITDMAMPNMSGDKLASNLAKVRSDIPIVLCTGFSEKIPAEKANSIGIQGFLMKPINIKDLSKKIREVLDEAKAKTQGSSPI